MDFITKEADDEMLRAQASIWKYMLAFTDSMALRCAVELRVADIINSHGHPISLSQIAASIEGSNNSMEMMITYLERIMRLLVRRNIFTASFPSSDSEGETLYGLSLLSKWIVRESDPNLVDMIMLQNHPLMLAPWGFHSQCIKEGGLAFKKANGAAIWDLALENLKFNQVFNDGMACTSKFVAQAIFGSYKDGFASIGSLADVGGGTGALIAEIMRAHPQIRGINFDLPHVVATAPPHDGVKHVGGNMLVSVPAADAFFMKWVLHDHTDEDCIKILKNCKRSLTDKNGKLIIVDFVLRPEGNDMFDDLATIYDMVMLTKSSGGKERTEVEWKKILEEGGFPRFRIIKIPAPASIIEAFPH